MPATVQSLSPFTQSRIPTRDWCHSQWADLHTLINISWIPPQLEAHFPDFAKLINNAITHSLTFCNLRPYHGVFSFAMHVLSCYSFIHAKFGLCCQNGQSHWKKNTYLNSLRNKDGRTGIFKGPFRTVSWYSQVAHLQCCYFI